MFVSVLLQFQDFPELQLWIFFMIFFFSLYLCIAFFATTISNVTGLGSHSLIFLSFGCRSWASSDEIVLRTFRCLFWIPNSFASVVFL